MSPALLLPAALSALGALLIPLVIHIARRTESRAVNFTALRWLDPRPAPRHKLRIDERWLLAVRLLLLAAVALWLARPVLWGVEDDRRVIAVAPGVNAAAIRPSEGDDRRIWLAPGWPALGGPAPGAAADVISLMRQLDAELPPETPLEFVVPVTLDGVDAERPRLTRRVTWRVAPDARAPAQPARKPPALTVRHSAEAAESGRYFRAAATAWTQPGAHPAFTAATRDVPLAPETRHLVWLAAGPLPQPIVEWIRGGGTALLSHDARLSMEGEAVPAWRDRSGEPLALAGRLGGGRLVQLTRPLEPAAIPELVEPSFPDALLRMLEPPPLPSRVNAVDHAPLAGVAPYGQPPLELRPWLALLIALVFALERWLATRRGRGVPA
jgi:hypothetical protein